MTTVGLRELRQHASDLVRRAEQGERIDITVSGRRAASLVPASPRTWRPWADVAGLFDGESDPEWARDRDFVDQVPADPWEPRRARRA